jgi:hypothetical protein
MPTVVIFMMVAPFDDEVKSLLIVALVCLFESGRPSHYNPPKGKVAIGVGFSSDDIPLRGEMTLSTKGD